MVTIQAGRLVAIPFDEMMDPQTGKIRVRYVDVKSEAYQTLYEYMIRLKPEDVKDKEMIKRLAKAGKMSESEFVNRFSSVGGSSAETLL